MIYLRPNDFFLQIFDFKLNIPYLCHLQIHRIYEGVQSLKIRYNARRYLRKNNY